MDRKQTNQNEKKTSTSEPHTCLSYLFYHLNKIPDRNNLREEGFLLAHSFRGLSKIIWPYVLGQNIMVAEECGG
jgi:hypothetical protein